MYQELKSKDIENTAKNVKSSEKVMEVVKEMEKLLEVISIVFCGMPTKKVIQGHF